MLVDKFGRNHNYLRISLTDNCNLRCFYCMPEATYNFTPSDKLMQVSEIETLVNIFIKEGVTKIRLTGGEPFVRKDSSEIISMLAKLPIELTCTTNGIRVGDLIEEIINARFHSINVSLDTLQSGRFHQVTGRDYFSRVIRNIELLIENGIKTKINVVLMKGINDDEIIDFIEFTKSNPVEARFIEFMPFNGNRWRSNLVMTQHEILERISNNYRFTEQPTGRNDTAKGYRISGHKGSFAIISTMSEPFCGGCNRLRLTADGKLKNCLFSKTEEDLLTPLREGKDILPLIHSSVWFKAKSQGSQIVGNYEEILPDEIQNRSMITIGG